MADDARPKGFAVRARRIDDATRRAMAGPEIPHNAAGVPILGFDADKRNAAQSYSRELTGECVGPCGVDREIVPYILELLAIPDVYSWASCVGHGDGFGGFVWVAVRYEPREVPAQLHPARHLPLVPPAAPVLVVHPYQDNVRKIAFEFSGGTDLDVQMRAVLEYLWELTS